MTVKPGDFMRIVYDFDTPHAGELTLERGDVVVVTRIINHDWLEGRHRGITGNFPASFGDVINIPNGSSDEKLFAATDSFPSTVDGDLSFNKGDIIEGLKEIDANWWSGKIGTRTGIFPVTHASPLYVISSDVSPRHGSPSATSDLTRCQALVDYVAQLDEELSFQTGDLITIKNVLDNDWYIGECNGQTGIFLSTCVEIIGENGSGNAAGCPVPLRSSRDIMKTAKNSLCEDDIDVYVATNAPSFNNIKVESYRNIDENCRMRSSSLRHNSAKRDDMSYRKSDSEVFAQLHSRDPSTLHSSSFTTENTSSCDTSVTAYAKTLFCFEAESPEELTFLDNEIVTLIRHVDEQWILGEIDGKRGIFPANFVDIVVDCPYDYDKPTNVEASTDSEKYALILEDYYSPESDVLSVCEGETVTILRVVDDYWCEAKNDGGNIGYCPLAVIELVADEPVEVRTSRRISRLDDSSRGIDFAEQVVFKGESNVCLSVVSTRTESKTVEISSEVESTNVDLPTSPAICSKDNISVSNSQRELSAGLRKTVSFSETSKPKPPIKPKPVLLPKPQLHVKPKPKPRSLIKSPIKADSSPTVSSMDSLIQQEIVKALKGAASLEKPAQKPDLSLNELKTQESNTGNASLSETDGGFKKSTFYSMDNNVDSVIFSDKNLIEKPQSEYTKFTGQSKFFIPGGEDILSDFSPQRKEFLPKQPVSDKKPPPPRPSAPKYSENSPDTRQAENSVKSKPTLPARPAPVLPHANSRRVPPQRPPPRNFVKHTPSDLMGLVGNSSVNASSSCAIRDQVADLELRITMIEIDLQKCMASRDDLQRGATTGVAETHENIAFYEANIKGLTEELERLKENLARLQAQAAEDGAEKVVCSDGASEETEEKRLEVRRDEMRMKRSKVIEELYETEKTYLRSLQLCSRHFSMADSTKPAGFDCDVLFGNMDSIADLSMKFLAALENTLNETDFDEQVVGLCFLEHCEDMKKCYAPYCKNHDNVQTILQKYTENVEVQAYLERVMEVIKREMNVFDISSLLIKPVQRILKYPLLLNELLKSTEDDHPDKEHVLQAVNAMTDVATAINEYKRGKDLVYKYRQEKSTKNISFHSLKKKSARIKGRITSSIGVTSQTKDENFLRVESHFRSVERTLRTFMRNVQAYLDELQQNVLMLETLSSNIEDYYAEDKHGTTFVIRLSEATGYIANKLFNDLKQDADDIIVKPIGQLLGLFAGPNNIIEKRFDKLLDFDNIAQKTKDVDPRSNKALFDDLQVAKGNYEALNAQLLDELPKLCNLSLGILKDCRMAFISLLTTFTNYYLKKMCLVMELVAPHGSTPILDVFHLQHSVVVDKMASMSFMPHGFSSRHDAKVDKKTKRFSLDTKMKTPEIQVTKPQMATSQTAVRAAYPPTKLYRVVQNYGAMDMLDITVYEGDIVGVIKDRDPLGNTGRWYVDRGDVKGFVPNKFLSSEQSPCQPIRPSAGSDAPTLEVYFAEFAFEARSANEISLREGDSVYVIAKHDQNGNAEWWWVDVAGKQGYVPAVYLSRTTQPP